MIEITTTDFGALSSSETQFFYLYEIQWGNYNEGTERYEDSNGDLAVPLRLSNLDIDINVTFNSETVTFYPGAITHNEIAQSSDGRINDLTISVGNADRVIQTYIEEYDMIGRKIILHQSIYNPDNVPPAKILSTYDFSIKSVSTTPTQADFVLSLGIDYLQITFPGRRMFSRYCSWKFKDPLTCGYTGDDENCIKTWDACKAKGNEQRFGGFPGIINERFYV